MLSFKRRKLTELEIKLIKKIKQLEYKMLTLPAYTRKEKNNKNKARFHKLAILAAVIGIIIFATGWLAVALIGTALTIIIVECGLFSSVSLPFIARPLYNAYLGVRNLFNSEKIKSQNRAYEQCQQSLSVLKKLATKKESLSVKINSKLDIAIASFLCTLSFQEKATFSQLSLKNQIRRLKQEMKRHPTHLRKQKDKQVEDKIFYYSAMISSMGTALSIMALFMMKLASSALLLGPIFPVLVVIAAMLVLIVLGPIVINRLGYAVYLEMRDRFSTVNVKTENKHYSQLKKAIAELEKLNGQLTQLDKKINSQLEIAEALLIQVTNKLKQEKNNHDVLDGNYSKNNEKFSHYGPLFQLASSANQLEGSESDIQASPSLKFNYSKLAFTA